MAALATQLATVAVLVAVVPLVLIQALLMVSMLALVVVAGVSWALAQLVDLAATVADHIARLGAKAVTAVPTVMLEITASQPMVLKMALAAAVDGGQLVVLELTVYLAAQAVRLSLAQLFLSPITAQFTGQLHDANSDQTPRRVPRQWH
jgi:hypothetical protein